MQDALARVADYWDEFVDSWLTGADPADGPLRDWFTACGERDTERVASDGLPEPYGGDIRRADARPCMVVLAKHAGEYFPAFQARHGVFAQEIRACGSYSTWATTGPYLRDAWSTAVKPNAFYRDNLSFARRWLGDPTLDHRGLVVFDAYPWHIASASGPILPPRRFVDEFIWQPIDEIRARDVFAFGREWDALAQGLGLVCVDALGKGGRPYGSQTPDRAVRVYELPGSKRLVVEWHKGGSGPPSEAETRILKAALGTP